MDIEKTVQFILEQQAKTEANLAQLSEKQVETDEHIAFSAKAQAEAYVAASLWRLLAASRQPWVLKCSAICRRSLAHRARAASERFQHVSNASAS
jgi:hypothetical protein